MDNSTKNIVSLVSEKLAQKLNRYLSSKSRIVAFASCLFVVIICFACSPSKKQITCGNDPALLPDKGKLNEFSFEKNVVSESNSATISGYVHSLKDDEPAVFAKMGLQNAVDRFNAISNIDGQFYFKNINPGTYQFTARCYGHRELIYDSIEIELGNNYQLDIKLGFIGKDEKARK
jgi:hypothetical protein